MERPEFETSPNMKTVGLMLQPARELWSNGKEVIVYIGFYVLKGILYMRKRGVYGSALIKQRCFWPREDHGDGIDEYFSTENIGDMGCLRGEWDETEFNIF